MAAPDPIGPREPRSRKRRRPNASADTLNREIALANERAFRTPTGGRRNGPNIEHPPPWHDARDRRGYRVPAQNRPDRTTGKVSARKGKKYPRNPPTIAESVRFLRACEDTVQGRRRASLYVMLWRTGMRINEALHLLPSDVDEVARTITVRYGKGSNGSGPKTRVIGMDPWGWQQMMPWKYERGEYPAGPLFPVLTGPTAGTHAWLYASVDREFKKTALAAGIDKRWACHQARHAYAQERKAEGEELEVIQHQMGHSHMWITMRYLAEFNTEEVLKAARSRPVPMMPVPDVMALYDLAV